MRRVTGTSSSAPPPNPLFQLPTCPASPLSPHLPGLWFPSKRSGVRATGVPCQATGWPGRLLHTSCGRPPTSLWALSGLLEHLTLAAHHPPSPWGNMFQHYQSWVTSSSFLGSQPSPCPHRALSSPDTGPSAMENASLFSFYFPLGSGPIQCMKDEL